MAALHPIYNFSCYREYLKYALDPEHIGRGGRGKLAQHLDCQASFVSQVLSGKNELSLEHAYRINEFLHHEKDETDFFMALVHHSRAGAFDLQSYYSDHLKTLKMRKLQISEVSKQQELSEKAVVAYTSNWLNMAIHMMVSIPSLRTRQALQEKLRAKTEDFEEAVDFLKEHNLIVENKKGELGTGTQHIHLKKSSPHAQAASVLTRLKVLDKLKISDPKAINYALNLTLTEEGVEKLRKLILDFVAEISPIIAKGEPDKFCTLIVDLIEH